jgi:hypothetical protein
MSAETANAIIDAVETVCVLLVLTGFVMLILVADRAVREWLKK